MCCGGGWTRRWAHCCRMCSLWPRKRSIREVDRVLDDHGAVGFQIHSSVDQKALDQPEFRDIFAKIADRGKAVWLHPTRPATHPDYLSEDRSHYPRSEDCRCAAIKPRGTGVAPL